MPQPPVTLATFDAALGPDLPALIAEYRRALNDFDHEPAEPLDQLAARIVGTLSGRRDWIEFEERGR